MRQRCSRHESIPLVTHSFSWTWLPRRDTDGAGCFGTRCCTHSAVERHESKNESGPTPTHNRPTPVAARANQHSGVGQSPSSTTGQTSRAGAPANRRRRLKDVTAEVERLLKDLQDFEVQEHPHPQGHHRSLRSAHASLSNRLGKQQNGILSATCRERLLTAEMGFKRRPLPPLNRQ